MLPLTERFYEPVAGAVDFDGRLLLRGEDGALVATDIVSKALWDLIGTGLGHEEILSALARQFGQPLSRIRSDVDPLIETWLRLGLIEQLETEQMPAALLEAPPHVDGYYGLDLHSVRIRCHVERYAGKIASLYQHARRDDEDDAAPVLDFGEDEDGFFVARNGNIVLREQDQGAARGGLLVLWLQLSADDRPWLACLHASAVGRGDHCLIFSGDCGAGKTTLTLGMVHAGFEFLVDDMVPIDAGDHSIWPLPLAMSLKEGTVELARSLFPDINALPAVPTDRGPVRYFFPSSQARPWAKGGLPAAAMIFPRYEAGADLCLSPLDRIQALQRLANNGSSLDIDGRHLQKTLNWLETIPCFDLHYSHLDDAVRRLADLDL